MTTMPCSLPCVPHIVGPDRGSNNEIMEAQDHQPPPPSRPTETMMDPQRQQEPISSSSSTTEAEVETPTNNPPPPPSPKTLLTASKIWNYLNQDIKPTTFAEIQLTLLTFCIGLQDAVSFPDFHCFASNQTGNTVFLVLAIILPEMDGEMFVTSNIAVALGFFLAAAYLTGQLGHIIGPRRRLYIIICNLIQTCLVFATAVLQYKKGVEPQGTRTLLAIGFLATAAGSQVVVSRSLKMTEISTAMATAAWLDLVIDPDLMRVKNRGRNRRLMFLGSLILGTLVGAVIFKRVGSAVALFVSAGGKGVVTGMWFGVEGEESRKREGREEKGEMGVMV
ncbi:uncharacterized protein PODANS_1_10790 [Podospora anserina S mat+]|uniref:Podospora anserina S mat+ genomic DNA chromosome 1, supercontig 2 n=1 Tax=Podospora anserina (strain S / ATCC MYA-4624 / DSM 980 / FGSC 10383) TaxID=515849 RepID=B2AYE1_PODAN|nr:uncharacterized protein PODANS_1_10790 [Podospora anserina S mat+]CAP69415.1 unnamed protein product [Podospora anserina S mat+]CDP23438.1 Putative protein of unknown function [Podospora anserina S mat+]